MLRKLLSLVVALVVVFGVALMNNGTAGVKRYYYHPVTKDTVILTGATDSNYLDSEQFPLYDNSHGNNITKYDKFMICYHFNAASENLDVSGVLGENNTDSVIVRTIFGAPYYEYTLFCDTCGTLPCTVYHAYSEELMYSGVYGALDLVEADSSSDSSWANGYFLPNDSVTSALWMDYFYFEVYCADSAAHGTGDTLEFIFDYWYKFIEDGN